MNRKAAVAGTFYPNSAEEIGRYVEHFSQNLHKHEININPKAVIVPHAGYVYSGFTANLAYYFSKNIQAKRCVVIGPSHRVYIKGASVSIQDEYETPLGNITIDQSFAQELKNKFSVLSFDENVHYEHSTETQAPFIKHYFSNLPIVEIVYGEIEYSSISEIIEYCLANETFVIISTDLSHFHDLKTANMIDNVCIEAILHKKISRFDEGCEACGITGVKALVEVATKQNLQMELLNYCTSFDRTNDDKSVVGYTSFLVG